MDYEFPYVEFLRLWKVAVGEYRYVKSDKDFSNEIKEYMKLDKDLIDKSQSAFVSFIRYYKEH